jgi:hypothetical protein
MLKNFDSNKSDFTRNREYGLPESYPRPLVKDLLFYIQRNLNYNTVVYTLNTNYAGVIDPTHPLNVFWIRYEQNGETKQLNPIQTKLAYGYKSTRINNETFKFQLVSYNQDFYLAKNDAGNYIVSTELEDELLQVSNIYVYAEDFGVFPQVKYIEFFGDTIDYNFPVYKKIVL